MRPALRTNLDVVSVFGVQMGIESSKHGRETIPIMKLGLFAGIATFTMLLILSPYAAEADVVVLKSGDRIFGRIIKMQ